MNQIQATSASRLLARIEEAVSWAASGVVEAAKLAKAAIQYATGINLAAFDETPTRTRSYLDDYIAYSADVQAMADRIHTIISQLQNIDYPGTNDLTQQSNVVIGNARDAVETAKQIGMAETGQDPALPYDRATADVAFHTAALRRQVKSLEKIAADSGVTVGTASATASLAALPIPMRDPTLPTAVATLSTQHTTINLVAEPTLAMAELTNATTDPESIVLSELEKIERALTHSLSAQEIYSQVAQAYTETLYPVYAAYIEGIKANGKKDPSQRDFAVALTEKAYDLHDRLKQLTYKVISNEDASSLSRATDLAQRLASRIDGIAVDMAVDPEYGSTTDIPVISNVSDFTLTRLLPVHAYIGINAVMDRLHDTVQDLNIIGGGRPVSEHRYTQLLFNGRVVENDQELRDLVQSRAKGTWAVR